MTSNPKTNRTEPGSYGLCIVYRSSVARQLTGYFPQSDCDKLGIDACELICIDELTDFTVLRGKKSVIAAHQIEDRKYILDTVADKTNFCDPLVHPTSTIAANARLGSGTVIGPYCYIGPDCQIGNNTIILSHCSIGDGCNLGVGNLLAPNVHFGHDVHVGNFNNFGIGTIANPKIVVKDEAVFGAGAQINMNVEVSGKFATSSSLKRIQI